MEMKKNQTFFFGRYPNLTSFFIGHKMSALNWSEVKLNRTCSNLKEFFLFQKVVQYINDFWDLFLNKVYAKITAIIRLSLKNLNRIIVKAF